MTKQLLLMLWASPTSVVATLVGLIGLPLGTQFQRRGSTIEIYGGIVTWILSKTPMDAVAMTLGHVVWGRSPAALDFCREHELVHVRQYERWGPLFIPLYLFYSFWMWMNGRHPYYDNPFEREAYGEDHSHYQADRPDSK